ncbi:TIGR04255 family protein (plasmid) [Cupriavidus necator]|nr:TIGR04255 family protein [Cupriavidus necator]
MAAYLGWIGSRPPAQFVSALRKEYPYLELQNEVTLNIGGANGFNNTHVFRSTKGTWTVSLKQNSFSIETSRYTEYAEMKSRALQVVEAASKIIDADFFTRVGLRYINAIDIEGDPVDGWVNASLTGPLLSQRFTGVNEYAGKMQLNAVDGGCLLQHGIRFKADQKSGEGRETWPEYVIDVDSFRTEVPLGDTSDALDSMHAQGFDVFDWALGDSAREYLSMEKVASKR